MPKSKHHSGSRERFHPPHSERDINNTTGFGRILMVAENKVAEFNWNLQKPESRRRFLRKIALGAGSLGLAILGLRWATSQSGDNLDAHPTKRPVFDISLTKEQIFGNLDRYAKEDTIINISGNVPLILHVNETDDKKINVPELPIPYLDANGNKIVSGRALMGRLLPQVPAPGFDFQHTNGLLFFADDRTLIHGIVETLSKGLALGAVVGQVVRINSSDPAFSAIPTEVAQGPIIPGYAFHITNVLLQTR